VSQSLSNILLHIIFSTKNREPWIQPEIENELYAYLALVFRECNCPAILINGAADHVHALCVLSRTITVADLLETVKKRSSKWIKTQGAFYQNFAWQAGYGAFSLGESNKASAVKYIQNQKEHHRVKTFQEEFREFLKAYQISYDEKYVWD
jgi:putative transposase